MFGKIDGLQKLLSAACLSTMQLATTTGKTRMVQALLIFDIVMAPMYIVIFAQSCCQSSAVQKNDQQNALAARDNQLEAACYRLLSSRTYLQPIVKSSLLDCWSCMTQTNSQGRMKGDAVRQPVS